MTTDDAKPSDEVLWTGNCSNWHYFGSWFFGLLVVIGSAIAIYFNREDLRSFLPWGYAVPLLLLLLVVGSITWRRGMRRYEITHTRVIVETGRFVKDSNEIRVQDIRSINVTKHGLAGFAGIGSVEFSSAAADDADVIFIGIANADHIRDLVRKLQS